MIRKPVLPALAALALLTAAPGAAEAGPLKLPKPGPAAKVFPGLAKKPVHRGRGYGAAALAGGALLGAIAAGAAEDGCAIEPRRVTDGDGVYLRGARVCE
ncbi:hypothetical protein [Methylobacterium nigriterrae]|uniref:hypothetical protein n=1 Tax=Methylobacterium nigriterrae TaxID=3127512 RepID=UPI003013FFB6